MLACGSMAFFSPVVSLPAAFLLVTSTRVIDIFNLEYLRPLLPGPSPLPAHGMWPETSIDLVRLCADSDLHWHIKLFLPYRWEALFKATFIPGIFISPHNTLPSRIIVLLHSKITDLT